ncbi:hypothetical protein D6T64_12125 [Cryobacterium melibiosiphilum]|uniref:HNH nuclease domain-containing protein n=1 Tax=Cryobacterium melibiosiphilum TaxID=995039 RepID=A0A3A5MPY0_9MICO|nr:HNH endonuclease [Cryobacterium melibiosiphilum]RJT88126.1 hypothetical protein D6T64_12125 [Cryobacterium melibiosiphilum]
MNNPGNDEKSTAIHFTPAGAEKMMARLILRSVDEGECRVWIGGRANNGYGVTGGGLTGKRVRLYTHRAAFAAANGGYLPSGVVVRHTCDNRPCVKPDHLVSGTTADNNTDTLERWTSPVAWGSWTGQRGTAHRSSKLNEDKVREIRRRYANGETQTELAREFGISTPNAWYVVNRKTWAHVE